MQSVESKCLGCRHSESGEKADVVEATQQHGDSSELNMIYIKCSECQIIHCKPCFKEHLSVNHHLRQHEPSQSSYMDNDEKQGQHHPAVFEIICQQCEQNGSRKFCENCQQHLCDKCSFRIHNKGKRARHNVLNNQILIRIQKLYFLSKSQTEEQFKAHQSEFDANNCLVVYEPQRPGFIEEFESLEVEFMNKLTIDEIESCLNRYPLISLFSVHESDRELAAMLTQLVVDSDDQEEDEEKEAFIFLGGFKIVLEVRRNPHKKYQTLSKRSYRQRVSENSEQTGSLTTVLNSTPSNPQEKKFAKKQSIDFSCGSKQEHQPIPEMHKLFKKSLKMSNRSLIIQIPETKQYKQSPIKSDREQGFIERNLKLLENAAKNDKSDKTITLHLDQNYNDISGSTLNYYEQSEYKSTNEQSILMMGTAIQDTSHDTSSFKLLTNNQSISQTGNSIFVDDESNLAASLSLLNVGSISLSTENSIRKRSRKAPIPYFQPFKAKNVQNLNNSYGYMYAQRLRYKLQKKFRELAQKGTLMITKKQMEQYGLGFDQKIIRKVKKNVCDEEIQYYSLNLELISVQSLYWILESIKLDHMTPSEKLILSRLKQSYNLKPAQKLWTCIIKYLESQEYLNDKMSYDKSKQLPEIIVGRQGDETLLEYQERWLYEDQQGPSEMTQQWEVFRVFLNEYFKKNKQITGGRYGCVQYVKLNGPEILRQCSLGRLSFFVQQAINKGLIRYHKTLLIQNYESFEKSFQSNSVKNGSNFQQNNKITELFEVQKQLKILKIQVTLIDIFLQSGPQSEISLAQIPLTFKKLILFDVNLLQLGYPKLKNMLQTLTDKLVLSSSKSHIKYKQIKSEHKIQQLRLKHHEVLELFVKQIIEVMVGCLMVENRGMAVQELYNMLNERLGFVLDCRVCDVGDFCQFLMYYCQNIVELQFLNGGFVVGMKINQGYSHQNGNHYHMGHLHYHYYNIQSQQQQCNFDPYNHMQYYGHNYCHLPSQYYCQGHFSPYENPMGGNQHHNQYGYCQYYMEGAENEQRMNYMKQHGGNYSGQHQYNGGYGKMQNPALHQNQYPQCYYNHHHVHNAVQAPFNMPPHHHRPSNPNKQAFPGHRHKHQHLSPSTEISTPKFNQSIQYIQKKSFKQQTKIRTTIQNFKWQSYLDDMSNFEDQDEKNNNFESESFTDDYRSIYNILDDDQQSESKSKLSFPKTFIQKQGSSHNHGELHISKITPIDERSDRDEECDGSLGLFDDSPQKHIKISNIVEENIKSGRKGQHTRVYSTTQARTKHQRMYSTTTAKN